MPEINTNNMTPEELNDHINGHPGGEGNHDGGRYDQDCL